ncbi:hypothetical protein NQ317_004203 [Molorchus minor]|uniref:Neuroblastoma-amplified sequence-like n=1 Tax=Molorchus minor TaxID=1323400 RepID=A0ABQ9IW89_9CUCU|nr:hypothetical protein NQ317_004203 [Molorchus minor]
MNYQIIALYKSPQINIEEFIIELRYCLQSGDINIDILSEDANSYDYLNLLSEFGYVSQINKYTRVHNTSKSCIDHIFLKNTSNNINENIAGIIRTNITDHYITTLDIGIQHVENEINKTDKTIQYYEKLDNKKLLDIIKNEAWVEVLENNNPNTAYNIFIKKIKEMVKHATTLVKQYNNKTRKRKPWITPVKKAKHINNLPPYQILQIGDLNKAIDITSAEKVKYLGIYIDRHLKWDFQIRSMVQKLRGLLYKFVQLKQILNISHLKIIYKALVESILSYGIIGWGGVGITYMRTLYTLQKRIIKLILGKDILFPTDILFQECDLFNIRQLYCYTSMIYQHKFRDHKNVWIIKFEFLSRDGKETI